MRGHFVSRSTALLACLWSSFAFANNGTGIDAQENVFGATNVHAITGHGRLTAGVSQDGDITVLSWPNPSYADQLGYISSNALDARDQPRFGANEGAGIFLGLACEKNDGSTTVSWLRDRSVWNVTQDYGQLDGPNPHTYHVSSVLGLDVLVVDAIAPFHDTLVRNVTVKVGPGSPIVSCALLSYGNLSPLPPNARVPELPLVDWLFDGRNDYAAIWDEDNRSVIHFHPNDERVHASLLDLVVGPSMDFGPIGDQLENTTVSAGQLDSLVSQLSSSYNDGSWAMITTEPAPSQHQVGFDATPFCDQIEQLSDNIQQLPNIFDGFELPVAGWTLELFECWRTGPELVEDRGWKYPATDPWTDVQDGTLSGHGLAAGEVASALRTELSFHNGVGTASLIIGFGSDGASAQEAVEAGRTLPVPDDAEQALETWLTPLRVPGEPGSEVWRVARRTLINLRVGTAADSGAVVASIARQPPYALDWPRDGAFFNVVFDASGQHDLVEKRNDLYASWQRSSPVGPTMFVDPDPPEDPDTGKADEYPADAWEMNYYADGMPGGTFRFEIDTTGFAVWAQVAHAGWNEGPTSYLTHQWPSIQRGANLLARWRDAATGLHAPAQEDDAAKPAQTLHGAVAVFGALDMAARAARHLGHDVQASDWDARASELRAAMKTHFYDDDVDAFVMGESGRLPLMASGLSDTGPGAWLIWPMTMYDRQDPIVESQLAYDVSIIKPVVDLETPGGLYIMKNTVALGVAASEPFAALMQSLPATLASQATPDTGHFGEVMVVKGTGSSRYAEQRVSTPHLWEGALYYLTVLAAEDPAALQQYEEILPPSTFHAPPTYPEPDAGVPDAGGDAGPDASQAPDAAPSEAGVDASEADGAHAPAPSESSDSGCGCALPRGGDQRSTVLLALLVGVCWVRRRCRSWLARSGSVG